MMFGVGYRHCVLVHAGRAKKVAPWEKFYISGIVVNFICIQK